MREIDNKEACAVEGGTNSILIVTVLGAIITFAVGVLSGYANPKDCNIKEVR